MRKKNTVDRKYILLCEELKLKLFEYEGKKIFSKYGISIPKGYVISNVSEIKPINESVIIKAQLLIGGRGKKGLIKQVSTNSQVQRISNKLLGKIVNTLVVQKLLIEEKLDILKELYVGVFLERNQKVPLIIVSSCGGVDIESVGKKEIFSVAIDPLIGLQSFMVRNLVQKLNLKNDLQKDMIELIFNLYKIFVECDAELVEINPLVITKDKKLIAADSKIIIDDSALYRQPQFQKLGKGRGLTRFEQDILKLGASGVEIPGGNIGVVTSGAGLQMATVDLIKHYGGKIAVAVDIAEIAFDSTPERMIKMLTYLKKLNLKAILINFFLQIGRCDILAKSIFDSLNDIGDNTSVIIRLKGNKDDLAKKILSDRKFFVTECFEESIKKVVEKSK